LPCTPKTPYIKISIGNTEAADAKSQADRYGLAIMITLEKPKKQTLEK